jgi:hypothetical protein
MGLSVRFPELGFAIVALRCALDAPGLFFGLLNMATEIQYRVFKEIYDDESERYSDLGTRSNLYLTLITFYLGVILLKFDDVSKFINLFRVSMVLFLSIGALLVLALLFTALALGIREYEGICDPEEVIQNFGKDRPSDEDFLDDRIVDLAVATNRNSKQNDRVAALLQWAARLIALAVLLQVLVFSIALLHSRSSSNGQNESQKKANTSAVRELWS